MVALPPFSHLHPKEETFQPQVKWKFYNGIAKRIRTLMEYMIRWVVDKEGWVFLFEFVFLLVQVEKGIIYVRLRVVQTNATDHIGKNSPKSRQVFLILFSLLSVLTRFRGFKIEKIIKFGPPVAGARVCWLRPGERLHCDRRLRSYWNSARAQLSMPLPHAFQHWWAPFISHRLIFLHISAIFPRNSISLKSIPYQNNNKWENFAVSEMQNKFSLRVGG